ncbi:MAG TPA: MdtA/MuxA family multidrug efflux RND transporter periplasmic adaptor subunit [Stellaceae bacterium]|nr:MdtA/MuxA family multidrug efflux RND transporter periplasmic adaptor subunit [Stellaceae bacterium]
MDDQPGPFAPAPGPVESEPRPAAPSSRPADGPPPQPRRRGLWWLLALVIVVAVVGYIVTHANRKVTQVGRFTSTTIPVGTATVTKGDMPVTLSALGTVTPLATVTVKTQINGQLIGVGFTEGQMVKKGDFLAQIDPRPYQNALEQAQGQLAKDQALLKNAEIDLVRYRTLVAQNSIAKQTLDTQIYLVAQDRGVVQSDQAQVDVQKLNLVYCHIVSPISGRVGLRQVDPGNYVQTSDANGLVVITQVQPMSVIFTLPEDNLPEVLKRVHGGATLQAVAYDRTGTIKIDTGTLATIDNEIDTSTGTVKLRALFNNKDQNLFPNQFVNIQLLVNTMRNVALVPEAAIQRGAPGTFVYAVKPDHTVTAQPVTLGPDDGTNVAVTKGLTPGGVVVVDGADRLKEGAKVTIAQPSSGAPAAGAAKPVAPGNGANGKPHGRGSNGQGSNGQGSNGQGSNGQGAHGRGQHRSGQ